MAYGVANQALLYSYDTRPDWIIRRVFYRPYMHIYGQIPLDEIDGVCVFVVLFLLYSSVTVYLSKLWGLSIENSVFYLKFFWLI